MSYDTVGQHRFALPGAVLQADQLILINFDSCYRFVITYSLTNPFLVIGPGCDDADVIRVRRTRLSAR